MQVGMIGLGRMGANMARRLMQGGHTCVGYDRDQAKVAELSRDGAKGATSLADFIGKLTTPRIVWIMLPAGEITKQAIAELAGMLQRGDIVIDGGNSHFKDDVLSDRTLREHGIEFVDCGTSGGVWGAERGYCLMMGGVKETVDYLTPIFRTLAPGQGSTPPTPGRNGFNKTADEGFLYCGPAGAGHFVKMVHNGIEYGIMQSFAEGFDLLHNSKQFGYEFPLPDVAELWRRGSVVSGWLLDLSAIALTKSPDLGNFEGSVADSGEGRWTVQAAVEAAVPVPVLTASLYARFRSRVVHTFGEKLLSAMRFGFGGHVESQSAPAEKETASDGSRSK